MPEETRSESEKNLICLRSCSERTCDTGRKVFTVFTVAPLSFDFVSLWTVLPCFPTLGLSLRDFQW